MSWIWGLIIGQVMDSIQGDEASAAAAHVQRSEAARETDEREWADRQTTNIHEWIEDPEQIDYTTVDTPAFARGVYEPWKEFDQE